MAEDRVMGAMSEMVGELRDDIVTRMKANEEMFDTEMDAFRNKLDSLSANVESSAEMLHPPAPPQLPDGIIKLNENISKLDEKVHESRDDFRKFKEYIHEHINKLVDTYEERMTRMKRDIDSRYNKS